MKGRQSCVGSPAVRVLRGPWYLPTQVALLPGGGHPRALGSPTVLLGMA